MPGLPQTDANQRAAMALPELALQQGAEMTDSLKQITLTAADCDKWKVERIEVTRQITVLKERQRKLDKMIDGYYALKETI